MLFPIEMTEARCPISRKEALEIAPFVFIRKNEIAPDDSFGEKASLLNGLNT